ncbi:hypothetical protein FRC08_007961 [Ceratobasidium sp. 394]|nr:hypothetical protein FRC08_007961 [Ceratobasidium sp. 394]
MNQSTKSTPKPNQVKDHQSVRVELPKRKKAKLETLFKMLDVFTKSTSDAFETAKLSSASPNAAIMAAVSPYLTGDSDIVEHWVQMAALDDAILAKYEPKDHLDTLERLNLDSSTENAKQAKGRNLASKTSLPGKEPDQPPSLGKDVGQQPSLRRSERTIKPVTNNLPKIITAPPPKPEPEPLEERPANSRPRPSLKRSFETKLTTEDRTEIKAKRVRSVEFNKPAGTNTNSQANSLTGGDQDSMVGYGEEKADSFQVSNLPKMAVKTRSIDACAQRKTILALKHAECVLFQAASFVIRCDGTFQESIGATLPKYDAEHVSDSAKAAGESIEKWCDANKLPLFADSKLVELPDVPFTLVDCKDKVLLVNLPGFYTQEIFTNELLDLRSRLHARVDQADVNGRGDPESYVTRPDTVKYPMGCLNFAAWVSDGHVLQEESRVSGDALGGGVQRFTDIQNHFHFVRFFTMLLNYALFRCFPESYKAHNMMRASLKQKFPGVKAISANNPNMMSGTSYIYNRKTNLHTDHREGEKGISPLVVMGDCKTGYLGVPRVRIKVKYLPRNLVFLRGRLLDHKVMEWDDDSQPVIDQETLNAQDWSDLKELFENALDAFYGESPATALPLIRGVLHECTRLVSVHKDPSLIYSSLESSKPTSSAEPASAFYTIYASAWFLMSIFARTDPSMLTEDEPTEPITYLLSALVTCEKGQKALETRNQERAWDLEVVWSRALIGVAQLRIDLEEDEDEGVINQFLNGTLLTLALDITQLAGLNPSISLQQGIDRLFYALDNRSEKPLEGGDDEEKQARDDRFARSLLDAAQDVLAVAEYLPKDPKDAKGSARNLKREHLLDARKLFARVVGMSNIPTDILAQAILGEAQAGLAIGAVIAEELEGEDENEEVDGQEGLRNDAVDYLKTAIEKFYYVRKLSSGADNKSYVGEEDLKPLLQEALVTMATLMPEGPEQDATYARYREEGGVLDDRDEDEDEDDEDESESEE